MLSPIVKTIIVPTTPQLAFDVFTRDIGKWWPGETHSLSVAKGDVPRAITVKAGIGGEIEETCCDGSRAIWGVITAWEPGIRVGFTWQLAHPPVAHTHVSVSFEEHPPGCRITLTHDGWDEQAPGARERHEGYVTGWDFVFGERFAAAFRAS